MDAFTIEIADAVVAALNGATLSLPFVAERSYVPVHSLAALSELTVSVVPAALTATVFDRSRRRETQAVIDVGIQKRIGDGPMSNAEVNAACDPLMAFAQEVADLFNATDVPGLPEASSIGMENLPIFDPKHLDEMRVFTSVVRLTFNIYR